MKKTFFTLLCLCTLCIGSAWGESWTWTSASGDLGESKNAKTSLTLKGTAWTASIDDDTYLGWSSSHIQIGSKNNPTGYTLTTDAFADKTITKVSFVGYSYNGNHTYNIKVGGISKKSGSTGSSSATISTSEISSSGSIEISFQKGSGSRALYVKSITIEYENATSTEPSTVTFNAGTNGICSTPSLTEESAGAGVTLPVCTANDGYVFKGWAEEGGSVVGQAGDTYKPSSDCTLYAVYTKTYVLTITQPADGGTLTVKNGETSLETGTILEVGTNLTCEVTNIPEGKRFSRFYAKWGEGQSKYKVTNPATFDEKSGIPTDISALEIYVDYQDLKKYTINYMVNGVNTDAQENVYEGTALVFPTVNDFGGKVFVGWSEAEIAEATDVKPALVETTDLTATATITYYAVFATLTKGDSETKTDVLDLAFTGVTSGSTSYTNWSNSNSTSGAAYAGNSAGSNSSIQLRWNSSDSKYAGIVTTISGGVAKKVTIEWESNTGDGRTLNVYGSNTAFTSWENVQTITSNPIGTIVKGTSTTLNIDGDYQYIALRSNSGAMYLTSISIEWQQGTPDSYSAYCTTVASRTKDVQITDAKYATLGLPYAVTIPEGVSAYTATVNENIVTLNPIEGTIPADCGVILYAETPGTYTFTETADVDPIEGNQLVAVTTEGGKDINGTGEGIYFLSTNTNGVVFKLANSGNIPQYKAYLQSAGSKAKLDVVFGDPTGITSYENENFKAMTVYNLQGVRVNGNYKGIVIMNGKKYINK